MTNMFHWNQLDISDMFDILEISGKYWVNIGPLPSDLHNFHNWQPWQVDFTSSTEIPASGALAVLLWIV